MKEQSNSTEQQCNKQNVTNRDLELRGADLWACCRNNYVDWMTLSYTRSQSIKNYMNGINPKLNWRYFKRRGWVCIKVHVSFNHGW